MARKITLSIPDMLHERLEAWRQSFNLSKMFQDALDEAIQKKEEFQRRIKEDQDMVFIIERLKKEKELSEGNYFEKGRLEGFSWSKRAHYDDLIYVVEIDSTADIFLDDRLKDYFLNIIQSDLLMDIQSDEPNKHAKLFIDGWRKGIADFWNEVKEKLT